MWFRVDDHLPQHHKVDAAGGDAMWLWVCGGCWTSKNGKDGKIPKSRVPLLSDRRAPMRLAARLVAAGFWEDCGDHFLMHDFLDWNPSAAEVADRRAKRSEAGKRGGKQSGSTRRSKAASKREAKDEANASANGQAKSNPEPEPTEEPDGSSRRSFTKLERDAAFGALVEVFGPARTRTTQGFYASTALELLNAGGDPPEILRRGRILMAKNWPDSTPKALAKHWDRLDKPATNGSKQPAWNS